jgi:hypothetical protein
MDVDTRCLLCHTLDEDGEHLFFKYKYAKAVWHELLMEDRREDLEN